METIVEATKNWVSDNQEWLLAGLLAAYALYALACIHGGVTMSI